MIILNTLEQTFYVYSKNICKDKYYKIEKKIIIFEQFISICNMQETKIKYTFEEYQIPIRNHNIYTKRIHITGSLSYNYALVFLHDGLGSVESWGDFPLELSQELKIDALLFDRRGYGRSSSYDFSGNVDFLKDEALFILPEILNTFKINYPIFVGQSDGGTIALIFSGIYNNFKSIIISIAAHTFVEKITIDGIKSLIQKYTSGKLKHKLEELHFGKAEILFKAWTSTWLMKEFVNYNILDYVKKIHSPILLVQGDKDEFGSLAQIRSVIDYAPAITEVRVFDNCGHFPHISHKSELVNCCKEFVLKYLVKT